MTDSEAIARIVEVLAARRQRDSFAGEAYEQVRKEFEASGSDWQDSIGYVMCAETRLTELSGIELPKPNPLPVYGFRMAEIIVDKYVPAVAALTALIEAKAEKDANGKTPKYESMQREAWIKAWAVHEAIEGTDK